jgi:hypothetical protein
LQRIKRHQKPPCRPPEDHTSAPEPRHSSSSVTAEYGLGHGHFVRPLPPAGEEWMRALCKPWPLIVACRGGKTQSQSCHPRSKPSSRFLSPDAKTLPCRGFFHLKNRRLPDRGTQGDNGTLDKLATPGILFGFWPVRVPERVVKPPPAHNAALQEEQEAQVS